MRLIAILALLLAGCGGTSFSALDSAEDAGYDARHVDEDAGDAHIGAGGAPAAGGARASTAGGAPAAGAPGAGGASTAAGGAPDACTPVTHDNGVGQRWVDCVPLGTYNETEARKACVAFTGDPRQCSPSQGCGSAPQIMQWLDPTGQHSYLWGYEGNTAGYVGVNGGCPNQFGKKWE